MATNRRGFLRQCGVAGAAALAPSWLFGAENQAAASERPNLVFILADDLGNFDFSCTGSDFYRTPNIDALKERGMFFTQAYASAPVCLPTRAAFVTGKTPARMNMTAVFDRDEGKMKLLPPVWNNKLPFEEETIAERLKRRGYATGIVGKWHLGPPEEYWPEHHGFDENIGGYSAGNPASYFAPWSNPRLKDGPAGEYLTDRLASEAAGFIERHKDGPFFLYYAPYSPHSPFQAPAADVERFAKLPPGQRHKNPVYAAMIAHLDAAVGKVVKTLGDAGLLEKTLLIFTSDNGGVEKLNDTVITDNAPLRGAKFQLYEGGTRVPAIACWPGRIRAGSSCASPVITHDWTATFLAMAGAECRDLDGLDLSAVLQGRGDIEEPRLLGWHYPHYMPREDMTPASAIRFGRHKLHYWHEDGRIELYDLEKDEGETTDLAAREPALASQMKARLFQWLEANRARLPRKNPDYRGV